MHTFALLFVKLINNAIKIAFLKVVSIFALQIRTLTNKCYN